MTGTASRLWISLVVCAVYLVIAIQGANMLMGDDPTSLSGLFAREIGWHLVLAVAILLAAIFFFRWSDLPFGKPHSLLPVLWFPTIFIAGFAAGLAYLGFLPAAATLLLLVNAMIVGFGEEVAFRGIVFHALKERMQIWPAIILTSVLFGSPHVLNGFITGNFFDASLQALAALMTGFVLIAILVRTGSLWPGIIYHALWDFLNFSIELRSAETGIELPLMGGPWPLAWIAANGLFGLYLLRGVDKQRN